MEQTILKPAVEHAERGEYGYIVALVIAAATIYALKKIIDFMALRANVRMQDENKVDKMVSLLQDMLTTLHEMQADQYRLTEFLKEQQHNVESVLLRLEMSVGNTPLEVAKGNKS